MLLCLICLIGALNLPVGKASWLLACSRLSDSGEEEKEKGTRTVSGARERKKEGKESLSPVSFRFIFVFALSQFSGPDYLGAWNRLLDYQHWPCLSCVFILPKPYSLRHALTTKWHTLEKKCFCGLLPLRGCQPQRYRFEWVCVSKEPEPTNSGEFDPIFPDIRAF